MTSTLTHEERSEAPPMRAPIVARALSGLLAAAVALGIGELVAGLSRGTPSPRDAVGSEFIDRTPAWLKDLAIDWFGTNDKTALRVGMLGVIALIALVLGVVAWRRRWLGVAGFVAFGLVGAWAAQNRPSSGTFDAVPSLVAAVAGAVTLLVLLGRLAPSPVAAADERSPASRSLRDSLATIDRSGSAAVNRRGFLLTSAAAAAIAAVAGGAGRALKRRFDVAAGRDEIVLPTPSSPAPPAPASVGVDVAGAVPFVTPNADFYRIDTALVVPQLPAADWRLRVHGMVDNELEIDFQDLLGRDMVERWITLTCVSNEVGGTLVGNARWLGVPLADILTEAGVVDGADQIKMTSSDGWTCGTPVATVLDGRDALLAIAMNGEPLPVEHGFPVRAVVPGLYGFVSACKWIVDIELTRFADFDAYWVRRGWAQDAPIKTQSRIDTPKPLAQLAAGPVAVAGVAWAQHRGITNVEVRVDDGPWQPARLADELTADTWRQWVHTWDATPGRHHLEVRATDTTGTPQPEERVPPIPDGATGWHSVVVTVT